MTSTAAVDEERFKDYDNDSVPFMKNILQHANDRQYRMLRGLMGVSVCNDMFAPDAHDLMHIMVPGSRESPNTSATENCISAFVKVAHGLSEKTTMKQSTSSHTSFKAQDPRETAPECPVKIVRACVCAGDWHPRSRRRRAPLPGHVHSLMNMQDSPAHGVLGQLMQDPEVHTRVQRAVEALSSSA